MNRQLHTSLKELRRELHSHPDLPGGEEPSCIRLKSFLEDLPRDRQDFEIISGLGGGGLAVIFTGREPGPTLMLRAETDALPIDEPPLFPHSSVTRGISHKCGHDGHMSILAGTASFLTGAVPGPTGSIHESPIKKGRLILLFQPAEETGTGALAVLNDSRYESIAPDWVFALHNWPGIPRGTVSVKPGGMFAASTGMSIKLTGRSSHASLPEEGISPVEGIKRIHSCLEELHNPDRSSGNFSLITTVGIRAGGEDFGISPGEGVIHLTVRAAKQDDLEELLQKIRSLGSGIAHEERLEVEFHFKDSFPEAANSPEAVLIVQRAAESCGIPLEVPAQGAASSEDIGHLLKSASRGGAIFLLGSGTDAPPLHSLSYDFDDGLIPPGVEIFLQIIREFLA